LGSPRLVYVLGEAQVRIKGVNRACTKEHIGQKNAQDDRDDVAGPPKTSKSYLPHVGAEKHHVLWHLVQYDSNVLSQLASNGTERVLGLEADSVSVPTRMITFE
jgi:hypothetical protein